MDEFPRETSNAVDSNLLFAELDKLAANRVTDSTTETVTADRGHEGSYTDLTALPSYTELTTTPSHTELTAPVTTNPPEAVTQRLDAPELLPPIVPSPVSDPNPESSPVLAPAFENLSQPESSADQRAQTEELGQEVEAEANSRSRGNPLKRIGNFISENVKLPGTEFGDPYLDVGGIYSGAVERIDELLKNNVMKAEDLATNFKDVSTAPDDVPKIESTDHDINDFESRLPSS